MKGHKCNAGICTLIYSGDKRSSTFLQIAEKTPRKKALVNKISILILSLLILMTYLGVPLVSIVIANVAPVMTGVRYSYKLHQC